MKYFARYITLAACLSISLTFSCTQDPKTAAGTPSPSCQLDTSQQIHYQNMGYATKYRITQAIRADDIFYMLGYNSQRHALEFIPIAENESPKQQMLERTGPNGVGELSSFYYHRADSIFLLTSSALLLLDESAQVRQRWAINQGAASDFSGEAAAQLYLYNDLSNNAPLHYDAPSRSLFVAAKRQDQAPDEPAYYTSSVLVRLYLDDKRAEALPIYYPQLYQRALYPANKPHFAYTEANIYTSFPNSAWVYRYAINDIGQRDSVFLSSTSTANEMAPFAGSDLYDNLAVRTYLSEQVEFKNLVYDPFKNLLYRFHFGPYPFELKGNEGKRGYTYLHVFNLDLASIDEIRLSLKNQYYGACPSPQGLLLYRSSATEQTNTFSVFDWACEG